nr:hypothetical protein [Tanacetum cinerariifolium]
MVEKELEERFKQEQAHGELFSYRLNPLYAIKECSSCGTLYTKYCSCSKGNVEDKILVPKPSKNCARCGHPVNGPYCQGCTLLREKLEEYLVTYFQNFQNTSESFDGSTNVVSAPREPFVVKQDHGVNPPHIDECCCECGEALDGIICQRCACKSYGKGAHIGYNCPPKVLIIFNPEPCNQTMNNEPPKFNRYSFFETSKVLLLAWDRVSEIKDAFKNKQNKPEDIQELFRKLLDNLQNIHEELAEFINSSGWNRHAVYDDDDDDVDYTITITPVLSTKEPDNSLTMKDEHLDTILATKSNEVIKSSVEELVSIPSESEGIPDTIDDDSLYYENIEYVEASPHDSKFVSLEVEKIVISKDEEIEDDNLRQKLLKFPPTDRSDLTHEEFCDEPAHIISPPEYDCFYFKNFPDLGELISSLNSEIRENLSSITCVNLPVKDDYSPLLAYVVWIFLAYLAYLVIPPHLHSFRNKDTIFDPGITINRSYSFKPGLSHRYRTFKKFNTHRSHLNESPMEMLFSTLFPMDQ